MLEQLLVYVGAILTTKSDLPAVGDNTPPTGDDVTQTETV